MLIASFRYIQRFESNELNNEKENIEKAFGGNDWVEWEDTDQGVVARQIHPLIRSNPLLKGRYVQVGDILKTIDYQNVYRVEVVEKIVDNVAPGTVILFQVQRPGSNEADLSWENILFENSFQPHYTFTENALLWSLLPWLLIFGTFLALVSILTIFPIVKPAMRENWALFSVILTSFIVFSLMGIRHLNLLVSNDYTQLPFERAFVFTFSLMLTIYGSLALYAQLRGTYRWSGILSLGVIALLGYKAYQAIFLRSFVLYAEQLDQFVLFIFLLHVFSQLLISVFQMWKKRSFIDRLFHILSIFYSGPLMLLYFGSVMGWNFSPSPGEFTNFLVFGAILIPLISNAAAQLKFGRVSLVVTGSLQYIIFAVIILILYYLIHTSLNYLGLQFKYQAYLELSMLIVLVLAIRFIYGIYEDRLRHYFVLAQQEKRDRIDHFTSQIPQYTSTKKLLEDLSIAVKEFFGTPLVTVRMVNEAAVGDMVSLDEGELDQVYEYLREKSFYWARNRQMAQEPMPPALENVMKGSAYALANPITVNEHTHGLLLLGKKRRGVYNLTDLEIISRIIQQTQLTLGVLHLLEREKILMQKNLE
ncbi:MAG TPA: hypothetical protein ENJ82_12190, partial [Bacteroidetes bacterium]|nr:hypothetical protein [Bacteroidota bacterium]